MSICLDLAIEMSLKIFANIDSYIWNIINYHQQTELIWEEKYVTYKIWKTYNINKKKVCIYIKIHININAWVLWLKYDLKEQACNLKKYWIL